MELRATLKEKKRIVIKVGTSTVTYAKTGNINLEKLEKFVRVLFNLRNRGKEIIVVSSGAVGIGKNVLGIIEKPAGSVKQEYIIEENHFGQVIQQAFTIMPTAAMPQTRASSVYPSLPPNTMRHTGV